MSEERDPRVVAIAENLAEVQPYGGAEFSAFDFRKKVPSAADYHAALLAVKTLDGMAEYEYGIEVSASRAEGGVFYYDEWYKTPEEAQAVLMEFQRVVKRRKAGQVEDA